MGNVYGWVVGCLVVVVRVGAAGEMTPAGVLQQAREGGARMAPIAAKEIPGPTPSQTVGASGVYLWGKVQKAKGSAHAHLPAAAIEVLTVRSWAEGILWGRREYSTLVVKVAPEQEGAFRADGFVPLADVSMHIVWSRRTHWNDFWNGRQVRYGYRTWTADVTFTSAQLDEAFQFMRDFIADPTRVLPRYPNADAWVRAPVGEPYSYELGFYVDGTIQITTGHTWTESVTLLFESSSVSGYYRR